MLAGWFAAGATTAQPEACWLAGLQQARAGSISNASMVLMLLLAVSPPQVLYHRDIWTAHSNNWWQPLQRCWGVMEQAAGKQAAAQAGSKV